MAVRISADFECGNGKNIRKIGDTHFALETDGDEAPGYNYYFYLKLIGESKKENLILDVCVDQSLGQEKYRNLGEDQTAVLWLRKNEGPWMRFIDFTVQNNNCYRISLSIGPGEIIYLSNMMPFPYSELSSWLEALAKKEKEFTQLYTEGKSSQGRDIYRFRITNPKIPEKEKSKILVISGEHGIEAPGLWAVRGIIEYLLTSISCAGHIRDKYIIDIFPQINPDGNVGGKDQKNGAGVDIFRDFSGASSGKLPESKEGRLLWAWIEDNPPDICLDFHGWISGPTCFRGNPPYQGAYVAPPTAYKTEEAKTRQAIVNDYLSWKTEALTYRNYFLPMKENNCLYQLALKYDSVGCLYEPNMYDGIVSCKKTGAHVLDIVIEAVENFH